MFLRNLVKMILQVNHFQKVYFVYYFIKEFEQKFYRIKCWRKDIFIFWKIINLYVHENKNYPSELISTHCAVALVVKRRYGSTWTFL